MPKLVETATIYSGVSVSKFGWDAISKGKSYQPFKIWALETHTLKKKLKIYWPSNKRKDVTSDLTPHTNFD